MSEQEKKTRGKYTDFNKTEYDKDYRKKNTETISIQAQRKERFLERLDEASKKAGINRTKYARAAIEKQLTADGYPAPSEETKPEDQ